MVLYKERSLEDESKDDFKPDDENGESCEDVEAWSWIPNFELSCKAVPIERILEALEFLPYAHPSRVWIEFLFLTGCRPSEAECAEFDGKRSFIKGNFFFWRVGKNQKGQWRREYLPSFFLDELKTYKTQTKGFTGKIFHTTHKCMTRYFNDNIRQGLSQEWQEKSAVVKGVACGHVLQMKGLRKSFATLYFWQYWSEYNDASVGLAMTCKRLRHSHKGMTLDHYIEQSERMNREKWMGWTPSKVLTLVTQRHVTDFDNSQKAIHEWL